MVSEVSSQGQVTIPEDVRDSLDLVPGDFVEYENLEGEGALLRQIAPFDAQFHGALSETLEEWASAADDEAFRGL